MIEELSPLICLFYICLVCTNHIFLFLAPAGNPKAGILVPLPVKDHVFSLFSRGAQIFLFIFILKYLFYFSFSFRFLGVA